MFSGNIYDCVIVICDSTNKKKRREARGEKMYSPLSGLHSSYAPDACASEGVSLLGVASVGVFYHESAIFPRADEVRGLVVGHRCAFALTHLLELLSGEGVR